MSMEDLASCPEILEADMATAYPGLPEQQYQSIAGEAQKRTGGRDWAMTACRLAWLDMQRENVNQGDEPEELEDYFQ